jgi:hypothetical protein
MNDKRRFPISSPRKRRAESIVLPIFNFPRFLTAFRGLIPESRFVLFSAFQPKKRLLGYHCYRREPSSVPH